MSWKELSFTEVFDIQGGTQPPKSQFKDTPRKGYVRLLQIRDFGEKPVPTYIPDSKTLKKCEPTDVLIGRYGASVGRICTGMEGAYNVALAKVINEKKIDKNYLKFWLESENFQAPLRKIQRTAQNGFNKDDLSRIIFRYPESTEKQASISKWIDHTLSEMEVGTQELQSAKQKLELYRQSILNAAIRGKLAPQNPKDEPASVLLTKIQKEKEKLIAAKKIKKEKPLSPINNDEIPFDLPQGWTLARLSEISLIQGGIQKQPKRAPKKNKFPFLRVANVYSGFLKLDDVHEVELFDGELEKLKLKKGDLLIVEGNGSPTEIGRMAKWSDEIENAVHQNHLIRSRPMLINSDYISYVWNSPFGRAQIFERAKSSSGLYTLSTTKVSSLLIPIPPLEEQLRIVKKVKDALEQIDNMDEILESSLSKSQQLKQSILKKAFEGNL